jgi:hypothetical protein
VVEAYGDVLADDAEDEDEDVDKEGENYDAL